MEKRRQIQKQIYAKKLMEAGPKGTPPPSAFAIEENADRERSISSLSGGIFEERGKTEKMAGLTEIGYKRRIIKSMRELGVFKDEFLPIIERTAELYVLRDQTREQFLNAGGRAVEEHTNKAGATNLVKSPYLMMISDIDAQLIVNERELGITPSSLKKINEQAMRGKRENALAAALRELAK